MAYVYEMSLVSRAALRVLPLLMFVSPGVFLCVFGDHLAMVVVGAVFAAAGIAGAVVVMSRQTWYVSVRKGEVLVRTLTGSRVCLAQDILGVETGVPLTPQVVQTRIYLKGEPNFISINEQWKTPKVVREVESGDERGLSSLLVEWFGSYTPETESETEAGSYSCRQAVVDESLPSHSERAEKAEDDDSGGDSSFTIDYSLTWPEVRLGRPFLVVGITLAIGALICTFCGLPDTGWRTGLAFFVVGSIPAYPFLLMLFVRRWLVLELRVKQDEIGIRSPKGWITHYRADILGVETGIPRAKEVSKTIVHMKNSRHGFSFFERWRRPTMIRHVELDHERELTPLLMELFGTYTPDRESGVVRKISDEELYELFIDTLQRGNSTTRCRLDLDIEHDIFEEFDIGVGTFLYETNLDRLRNAALISDEIVQLSHEIRSRAMPLLETKRELADVKHDPEWASLFELSDRVLELCQRGPNVGD